MRTISGACKVYNAEGTTFISDARYHIQSRDDSEGRQDNRGTLHDIEYQILKDMGGGQFVLQLADGSTLDIVVLSLKGMPPDHCEIRINTKIEF